MNWQNDNSFSNHFVTQSFCRFQISLKVDLLAGREGFYRSADGPRPQQPGVQTIRESSGSLFTSHVLRTGTVRAPVLRLCSAALLCADLCDLCVEIHASDLALCSMCDRA